MTKLSDLFSCFFPKKKYHDSNDDFYNSNNKSKKGVKSDIELVSRSKSKINTLEKLESAVDDLAIRVESAIKSPNKMILILEGKVLSNSLEKKVDFLNLIKYIDSLITKRAKELKNDSDDSFKDTRVILKELVMLHDQKGTRKEYNKIDAFGTAENLEAMEVQVTMLQEKLGFKKDIGMANKK